MSYGALFMLGCAYALLKGAHVRTDMLWDKFSTRKKGWIDAVAYLVFFLPTMAVLFFMSVDDFLVFDEHQREVQLGRLAADHLAAASRDPDFCRPVVLPGYIRGL